MRKGGRKTVTVKSVDKGSYAYKAGIKENDILISINGNLINDVLDYRFYLTDKKLALEVERNGEKVCFHIVKSEYADIGLNFETYLMDSKKSCKNKCVFCFIDQNPKGLRDTIYFKDDDQRLSFLMGNYITLTGLKDEDADRIIKMHMSPINISVHTTNPELRCKMMNNRFAGKSLEYLKKFHDAGIEMNCQIVLCKGLNDGDELINTMHDLASLYPEVSSVSVVPVGLTKYREGLYPLEPFEKEDAGSVIDKVEYFAACCKKHYGSSIFFCSDEFYLKAGRKLPDEDYYEGYPQIENGVGMMTSMKEEFDFALSELTEEDRMTERSVSLCTGVSAFGFISGLAQKLAEVCPNLKYNIYCIKNDFFGENVTVAGLVTATDILNQLKDKPLYPELLIPCVMLESSGELFLDSISVEEVEKQLKTKVTSVENDGRKFILSVLGKE